VLALFLFGGAVLSGFAFTMIAGIITGTYSSVFIASAIAILLTRKPVSVASRSLKGAEARRGRAEAGRRAGASWPGVCS
jgi:preprotein translocase subunit SecF